MAKILVADDEALKRLQENPDVDMVLTDINMPEMDGLTLLQKVHEVNPILQSVIVSAYGDMENIRTAMNRGAYDFITKPVNFEDLEITMKKTLEHVKQLRETLQAIKENNILKMYVDDNVLKFMGREEYEASLMRNETVEATVVFIDICGFTSISETQSPDAVVSLLNNIFDVMVKEILTQGGQIDKFIGDAVMAVFRGDFHLDRAIDASLAVRAQVEKMSIPFENYKPSVSTGINTGEMVSGNIGSVSLRRLDYTVIGDAVNLAQRMQALAGPGQILIPESGYLKVKDSFKFNPVGERQIKHKTHPVMLYEVLE